MERKNGKTRLDWEIMHVKKSWLLPTLTWYVSITHVHIFAITFSQCNKRMEPTHDSIWESRESKQPKIKHHKKNFVSFAEESMCMGIQFASLAHTHKRISQTHTHNNLSFAFSFACLDFIFVFFSATSSSSSPSSSLLASVQQYHEISVWLIYSRQITCL